jgi:broad specificity phosphatase PhoE
VNGIVVVAAAPTPALRRAQFGGDHDLDVGGANAAHALRGAIPGHHWLAAPTRAATSTARALGHYPHPEPALTDPDYGAWTGRTLDDLDPALQHAWLTDPTTTPPGGESLTAVIHRAGAWLDTHTGSRDTVAVAHPTVVRAALTHALGLPPAGIWQLDVAPLSATRLHHRAGRWHLHLPAHTVPSSAAPSSAAR